jgi:hypothetical protein
LGPDEALGRRVDARFAAEALADGGAEVAQVAHRGGLEGAAAVAALDRVRAAVAHPSGAMAAQAMQVRHPFLLFACPS